MTIDIFSRPSAAPQAVAPPTTAPSPPAGEPWLHSGTLSVPGEAAVPAAPDGAVAWVTVQAGQLTLLAGVVLALVFVFSLVNDRASLGDKGKWLLAMLAVLWIHTLVT